MTTHHRLGKEKRSLPSAGQLLFGFFTLFCLLLILRNAEIAIEYMNRGMLLCVRTVIPSLFPFMVISELIVASGTGERLLRHVSIPMRRVWHLSEAGCCALLLGMLCGFPVGARCVASSYERGRISKEEAERVLAFSGNPSSAFLVSAVGVSLWGNRHFGLALYLTVLAVALLSGLLMAHLSKPKEVPFSMRSDALSSPYVSGRTLFPHAMRSATASMLSVCAYVIFFSTLLGTLSLLLSPLGISESIRSTIFCTFELSGGVSAASALHNRYTGAVLSAFAAGWSGISVHCQILSATDGQGLSLRPYFFSKLLQGLLCAILFGLLVLLFPSLLQPLHTGVGGL